MVSFLKSYISFIPFVWRISSQVSMYSSQTCRVTNFTCSLLFVHLLRYGQFSHMYLLLLYSLYPSLLVVEYLYVWNLYQSPMYTLINIAINMIPTVIFGPFFGIFVDNFDHRKIGIYLKQLQQLSRKQSNSFASFIK